MNTIVFLTGPTCVGKTEIGKRIFYQLQNVAFLDGDETWWIKPSLKPEKSDDYIIENICFIVRNYIKAGFASIIVSWFLPKDDYLSRIKKSINKTKYSINLVTLECAEDEIRKRQYKRWKTLEINEHVLVDKKTNKGLVYDTTGKCADDVAGEIIRDLSLRQVP